MSVLFEEYYPMTHTENTLKSILQGMPEFKSHIFTADELANFLNQISKPYRQRGIKHSASFFGRQAVNLPNITTIADSMLEASPAQKTDNLKLFSAVCASHSEDLFLSIDHDIYPDRMIRYMPAHWHTSAFFEIYYAAFGNCPIHFQDETVILASGNVLIVAPDVVHATPCYHDDSILMYYLVRSSTFNQVFWNLLPRENIMSSFFRDALGGQWTTSYLFFDTQNDQQLRLLLEQITSEFQADDRYSVQMMNSLLSNFFILLLRNYEGTARLPHAENFSWKADFSAIFSYIQTNYATVTINEIAEHFNYSKRQLSRIVLKYTGLTFAELVLKLRMERAATLLQQRKNSTKWIAEIVGYSTQSSFYRAFEKYFGTTPSEYVKTKKGQQRPI